MEQRSARRTHHVQLRMIAPPCSWPIQPLRAFIAGTVPKAHAGE